ncbi:MAG: hypothetical protein LUQ37_01755 [Methanoregulaceae archaeon]|jgi:hypothetical protein|nr:hypothetical protein [Methanoregulaceae archaeon]
MEITAMDISRSKIRNALADRTRELIMARKALYAAATIHTTMIAMLMTCFAVMLHVVLA